MSHTWSEYIKLKFTFFGFKDNLPLGSFSMEMIGRFPTPQEGESLDISEACAVWLPVGSSPLAEPTKSKIRQLRDLSLN